MPRNTETDLKARMFRYFGRTDDEGHTDTSYPDTIKAIYLYTDDCIEFSKTLSEDLSAHAEALKKKCGKDAPRVHKLDFSLADPQLMPNPKEYSKWYRGFSKSPTETDTLSESTPPASG